MPVTHLGRDIELFFRRFPSQPVKIMRLKPVRKKRLPPVHDNEVFLRQDLFHVIGPGGSNPETMSLPDSITIGSGMYPQLLTVTVDDLTFLDNVISQSGFHKAPVIILRDKTTDLLKPDGSFSIVERLRAKKGAIYQVELYAADTVPEENMGPNLGLVDSTFVKVPHDMRGKSKNKCPKSKKKERK